MNEYLKPEIDILEFITEAITESITDTVPGEDDGGL